MSASSTVCMVGAGAFGLACALELARGGAKVLLLDDGADHANASAVAAGMLAPVGEALFDPAASTHYPMMTEALALWPVFAADAGLVLADAGVVVPPDLGPAAAKFGVRSEPHPDGLFIPSDRQVQEPAQALRQLHAGFKEAGGRFEARRFEDADRRAHDLTILAAGAGSPALTGLAPELSRLSPVKGQLAVLPHGPPNGPVVRWSGGYLAPQPTGARVGASMEPGRDDVEIDPIVIAGLLEAARAHLPALDVRDARGQAGVRMQTSDGQPLVGPSTTPGVLVATGARRNGWLFAPLVARMIAAYCRDEDPGAWAEALHPGRFA